MTKLRKSVVKYSCFNAVFWALAVAGTLFAIPWASNIIVFLVWLTSVLSISAYTLPRYKLQSVRDAYKDFPVWFHNVQVVIDVALACVFVASGWWITAIALIIGTSFECATKDKAGVKLK